MKNLYLLLLLLPQLSTSQLVDCVSPYSSAELDINNLRATISNDLQHFEDDGDAGYELPKVEPGETSTNSIYADGLWISGYDMGGQLHLSGVTYRPSDATDYYPGPLQNNGNPTADPNSCDLYNNVYKADRSDALLHAEYYDRLQEVANGADPEILTEYPFINGYEMPEYFNSWPGDNPDPNYDSYLAPYYDSNANGLYDPENGDYPGFDLSGTFDCTNYSTSDPYPLMGHQALWYVANDQGTHTSTGGSPLGIELQVMTFGYTHCDQLNDAVYTRYEIINRSSQQYASCSIGKWMDLDVGCPTDDYVGCDVSRGLAYGYNGDLLDNACDGIPGYGSTTVAQGVRFLKGPAVNNDGMDNPLTDDLLTAYQQNGIVYSGMGQGYGDGIIDNETSGMRGFIYYGRDDQTMTPHINGEPETAMDYANYLSGLWMDFSQITYGGNGIGGSIHTDFMYPGDSDPLGVGTDGQVMNGNWSEHTENFSPGDRRFLALTDQFSMAPGEINELILGYSVGMDTTGTSDAIDLLREASDVIQMHFDNCFQLVDQVPLISEFSHQIQGTTVSTSIISPVAHDILWDFGDGTQVSGMTTEHTYSSPGYYQVCATLTQCDTESAICEEVYISPSNFYPSVIITRTEGRGCGDEHIRVLENEIQQMLEGPDYFEQDLTYEQGYGPVSVTVYDEENFLPGDYAIRIYGDDEDHPDQWKLWKVGTMDTIYSQQSMETMVDQYIPEFGLVVSIAQPQMYEVPNSNNTVPQFIHASMEFADEQTTWLSGLPDVDAITEQNWIRSGTETSTGSGCDGSDPNTECYYSDKVNIDPNEIYEDVLGGTWSPFHLVSQGWTGPFNFDFSYQGVNATRLEDLNNVVVRMTSDKAVWSRCAVVETQHFESESQGGAVKNTARLALSVDKNGLNQLNGGDYNECTMNGNQVIDSELLNNFTPSEIEAMKLVAWPSTDPNDIPNDDLLGLSFGMGWFPGYAVDIETGYRVNIAFGENSGLPLENGRDMIWNPTSAVWSEGTGGQNNPLNARFGGGHYIYVFRNFAVDDTHDGDRMRGYDDGQYLYDNLNPSATSTRLRRVWRSCTWVNIPILNEGFELNSVEDGLIPSETTVRLNVAKDYRVQMYEPYDEESIRYPLYNFTVNEDVFSSVDEFSTFDMSVFPNPGSDILNISTPQENPIDLVTVMDYMGRTVLRESTSSTSRHILDIARLSPGMYLLQVEDSEGNLAVEPFVKQY